MSKDREGHYHPPKGKPSGADKDEGLGFEATPPEEMERIEEITDEYLEDTDELADNVPLRHVNRNTSKGETTNTSPEKEFDKNKTLKEKASPAEPPATVPEELPGLLTTALFKEIGVYESDICISIFMDAHSAGMEVNEKYDLTNFKKALQNSEDALNKRGMHPDEIEQLLQPGYALLQDEKFWLKQSQGLAVFIAKGYFKYIKMPLRPGSHFVIEKTFYVTPLLPVLMNRQYYYLLTLSKKKVSLYKGTAFGLEYIEVDDLPESIGEEIADTGVSTTYRTGSSTANGGNYHGIADGNNDDKAYLTQYLNKVDQAIWKQVLHTETAPLLLAGVEYLIPLYKQVSEYRYIWDDPITGNRDYMSAPELFKIAIEKIHPYFKKDSKEAVEKYGNLSSGGQVSSKPDEIISAAYYSRVAQLFVQKGVQLWGSFDEMNNQLTRLAQHDPNAEDLVDNAVVKTLIQGGEVFLLEADEMPNGAQIAAIFRY